MEYKETPEQFNEDIKMMTQRIREVSSIVNDLQNAPTMTISVSGPKGPAYVVGRKAVEAVIAFYKKEIKFLQEIIDEQHKKLNAGNVLVFRDPKIT